MPRKQLKYQINPVVLENQQIYEHLYTPDVEESLNIKRTHRSAFLVHLVLKLIPVCIFLSDYIYNKLFNPQMVEMLLALFVVVEFWMTKNYTGRMMAGLWWGFEELEGKYEVLKVEMRVNMEVVNSLHIKLFWLLQIAYFIVALLLILTQFFISTNIRVAFVRNFRYIALNTVTFTGATANLVMFFRAYLRMEENHYFLKYKLGRQYIRRLGNASMVSYL